MSTSIFLEPAFQKCVVEIATQMAPVTGLAHGLALSRVLSTGNMT